MTVTASATGRPVTVVVVEVGVVDTAHRGWLGVVTGISAASTGDVLVLLTGKGRGYSAGSTPQRIPHKK